MFQCIRYNIECSIKTELTADTLINALDSYEKGYFMSLTLLILIAVIVVALAFEFINGFHDLSLILTFIFTKQLTKQKN